MLSDESMSTFSKEVPGFKDYVGGTTTCQTDGRPEVFEAQASAERMLLGESTRSFRKEEPGFENYFDFEFKVTSSSHDDGNCTHHTTDAARFKKAIPRLESQRDLSTANSETGVSLSLQAPDIRAQTCGKAKTSAPTWQGEEIRKSTCHSK
jgi:hypothetical protein